MTFDIIARKGKRNLVASATGNEDDLLAWIESMIQAGWVVAYSPVRP